MVPHGAALLVIDVQKGFDTPGWGRRNNPEAESVIASLLEAWRAADWPVVHAQHVSVEPGSALGPEQPGVEIKPEAEPREGEPLFQKSVNSAFIGTGLEEHLRSSGIESLVVVGLTTNHCVSTTARMAGNLGFTTLVVEDATATFDRAGPDGVLHPAELVHAVSLANLHEEFAAVVHSSEVLSVLKRTAD
ncbi:MAG: cysteine hydrolase [marine benthic group bacterium]|nr:cysteine hydrolase [Gemmatimonadota bacterium]